MDPIPDGMMTTLILAIITIVILSGWVVYDSVREAHRKRRKHSKH